MGFNLTYTLDRLEGGSSRRRLGRAWIASIAALWVSLFSWLAGWALGRLAAA